MATRTSSYSSSRVQRYLYCPRVKQQLVSLKVVYTLKELLYLLHSCYSGCAIFEEVVMRRFHQLLRPAGLAYQFNRSRDASWTTISYLGVIATRVKGFDTSKLQPGGSSLDRCQPDLAAHNGRVTYDGGLSQRFTATTRGGR